MTNENKDGVVYSLIFPDNKRYIGVTTTGLRKRLNNHNCNPSKTSKISKAIKATGIENVKVEILDTFNNKEEKIELEKKYIEEYNTTEEGYNMSKGGIGTLGYKPSDEQRKNMSKAQKERFKDPVQRKKLSSQIKTWIKDNPEEYKKLIDSKNKLYKTEEYREKARAIRLKVSQDNPQIAINHSKYMLERYKNNPDLRMQISRAKGGTPIEVYKDGEKVGEYDMIIDCAKELGLSTGNVASVLKGTRSHTKGYTFKRKENV